MCGMTALPTLHTLLGSAGVRCGSFPVLLRPSSAQQMVARPSAAVTRVQAYAAIPQQAVCFSTGSRLQTNNTAKSAEAKDQAVQQLMVELLPELEPLGVTPQLLRKVLMYSIYGSVMTTASARQLKDRFANFHQLAAADTEEQRTLVNKQLGRSPDLLASQASHVAANAAELRDILYEQLNIPATAVQQLITMHLTVLVRKPQSVAEHLQGWASTLQLDVASVLQDIWCRKCGIHNIIRTSPATVAAAFQQLQCVLQLTAGDVLQMVLTQPSILCHRLTTLEHKLQVLSQLLGLYGWTQQQLGQALLKYPSVLTRSVDSLNFKWNVFHQYAAAHPPSQQQMQDKCRSSGMLAMFTFTSKQNIKLMQYIMQYHEQPEQQQHGCPAVRSARIAQQREEQSGSCRRRRKQHRVAGNSSSATLQT